MGRHCLVFLGCQRCPQRPVLAPPAKKPSVAILPVWTRDLVDQEEPAITDDAADLTLRPRACKQSV
jgi:hypothetical protein